VLFVRTIRWSGPSGLLRNALAQRFWPDTGAAHDRLERSLTEETRVNKVGLRTDFDGRHHDAAGNV
jgi:hypothetical protein